MKLTCIVLSGGTSRRMGRDKATMLWQGKSFVEHVISAADPIASDFLIVSDDPDHDVFGYERVPDLIPNSGPVSGICSGLQAGKTEWNLLLSCDVPFIKTELLQLLYVEDIDAFYIIHFISGGRDIPLIGLYRKTCLEPFKKQLEKGRLRVMKALATVQVKTVEVPEELERAVRNLNRSEDLRGNEP